MGVTQARRLISAALGLLLALASGSALADSPDALGYPDLSQPRATPGDPSSLGFTPQDYKFDIPLTGSISFQRQYTRLGDSGPFSLGMTEHAADLLKVQLSKRGTFQLSQDELLTAAPLAATNTFSRKRSANWTQGFGAGPSAGTLTLAHDESYTEDRMVGYSWSKADTASLTAGLGKSLAFTATGGATSSLATIDSTTRTANAAITKPGSSDLALAEFHYTSSQVGFSQTDTTQSILRTPTIKLSPGLSGSLAATQTHNEIVGLGSDTANGLALTTQVAKNVTLTASRTGTDRSYAADSVTDAVGSQIKVLPDTTVAATYTDTATVGAGVSTTKSVEVTKAPPDGKGLGLHAGYTGFQVPGVEVAPTVDFRLDYTTPDAWGFHGVYHDESTRPSPELQAGVEVPALGGTVKLHYSEYALDPTTYLVQVSRTYGAEVARPLGWGWSGKLGYQYSDSLAGDSVRSQLVQIALGGDSKILGKIDLQYQQSFTHGSLGLPPNASSFVISFTRPIGSTSSLALSGHQSLPAPGTASSTPDDEQVQLDLKTTW